MIIIPRGKRVLVRRDDPKERENEYGIITPENVEQEQKAYGTVVDFGIAVAEGDKRMKEGVRVIYGAYAGEDIEIEEKGKKVRYKILDDEDVIAYLEG